MKSGIVEMFIGSGGRMEEQIGRAMELVPDEVVQLITASGTPEECVKKVEEYRAAGCTCPVLYPLGDVKLMIDTFAANGA